MVQKILIQGAKNTKEPSMSQWFHGKIQLENGACIGRLHGGTEQCLFSSSKFV
jgi:hypothetical protein